MPKIVTARMEGTRRSGKLTKNEDNGNKKVAHSD